MKPQHLVFKREVKPTLDKMKDHKEAEKMLDELINHVSNKLTDDIGEALRYNDITFTPEEVDRLVIAASLYERREKNKLFRTTNVYFVVSKDHNGVPYPTNHPGVKLSVAALILAIKAQAMPIVTEFITPLLIADINSISKDGVLSLDLSVRVFPNKSKS